MKKSEIEKIANEILKDVNEKILLKVRSNGLEKGLIGITKTKKELPLEYLGPNANLRVDVGASLRQNEGIRVELAYKALKRIINESVDIYFNLGEMDLREDCTMIPYTKFKIRK